MTASPTDRRYRRFGVAALLAAGILSGAVAVSSAEQWAPERYEVDGRKSGYLFLSDATRALQDDDFQNPAWFAIETGADLWTRAEGAEGLSCASCHEDAARSMRGVAARYPVHDADRGGLVNLELRINEMRTEYMKAEPYAYESPEMLALSAYVALQSRGMPMEVAIDGPAAPYFEQGRDFYYQRRGQLDLSCNQCHEDRVGQHLRGDVLSQGQINGFPFYRMMWRTMGSRHRMFAWCNTSVRAEPYPLGSDEYLSLELYLAWVGRGLPMESPAVRR